MLEGHVEIGQNFSLGHQRNQVVDAGIGIDVVQAHPQAELAEFAAQFKEPGLDRPAGVEAGAGKVLMGLMRSIDRAISVTPVESVEAAVALKGA